MAEDPEKSYESVKVVRFDPLHMVFDEWYYNDFKYLIGARNARVYYLLSTEQGLAANEPVAADPANPTATEMAAMKKWRRDQLELFSVLMMSLPKHLQGVARAGADGVNPNGREACENLVRYHHDHDPSYLPDLSYEVQNLTLAQCDNSAEEFVYQLDHKCAMLEHNADYAVAVQAKITILVRALKADSRFDVILQEHAVNPYVGVAGFEKLKRTTATFAKKFGRDDGTGLDAATTSGTPRRREQALRLDGGGGKATGTSLRLKPGRKGRMNVIDPKTGQRLCWNCGKPGHMREACTAPKEEKANFTITLDGFGGC